MATDKSRVARKATEAKVSKAEPTQIEAPATPVEIEAPATPVEPAQADDILSFDEAMEFLGTSQPTLYRLLKQGAVQGLKVGRQWRFRRADLVAYMERKPASLSQTAQSEADAELAFLHQKLGRELPLPTEDTLEESKTVALVNAILSIALEAGASDVHFEPKSKGLLIRHRVDGVLHEIRTLPEPLCSPVVNRLKTMASMDLNEKRLPQDGMIALKYQDKNLTTRVASCPSGFGESITLRLIDPTSIQVSIERLGYYPEAFAILNNWLQAPNGLVLITGPTGSGKTTVLYSCMGKIADETKKTVTIEDPVEITLPHTTQTHVDRKSGLTYATALRAFLRHDPDIIMIGEITNLETANAALYAAITGHLVLASMHTDSAAGTITRLIDLGVEPFLLGAGLLGISNQRLVRRLCPHCLAETKPETSLRKQAQELAARGGYEMPKNARFQRAQGCENCRQTGYRGRIGIYELLNRDDALKAAIIQRSATQELHTLAVQNGMQSLFADGVRKAVQGITTLDEVIRVTGGR